MKQKKFWLEMAGIIALVSIIGFSVVGCKTDEDNDNDGENGDGTFTLTGIPTEYNGMYAGLEAVYNDDYDLIGVQSVNSLTGEFTGSRISSGTVSLSMWIATRSDDTIGEYEKYSGNHTVSIEFFIFSDAELAGAEESLLVLFYPVIFKNGSSKKSWSENVGIYN